MSAAVTGRARAAKAAAGGAATARVLATLEALRWSFGTAAARQRRALLRRVLRARLGSVTSIERLHECLLAARAYPDDPATLTLVERALAAFARRADVRARHARLADSGIAGADIRFAFFAPTARRLAARWPERLELDWTAFDEPGALEDWLPQLAHDAEVPGLDEYDYGLRGWLARLKPAGEADGAFVARQLSARLADDAVFERVHDGLGLPYRLRGDGGTPSGLKPARGAAAQSEGPTPSRTLARWPVRAIQFQHGPFAGRPDLAAAAAPRSIRTLSPRDGERALALTTDAMVTRSRDLDVFAWGDVRDVRHVDCGDGLSFLMIGALPERRLLLESVYGFLTLKNGVPIGYVLTSALYRSAEIAFNVFDTFRGAEAGPVYGKVVGMIRALFGTETFTIYPYQLGDHNDEAIESGAWWFYQKLGFRPRARAARTLMQRELARMQRTPGYRSGAAVLRKLARTNLYWSSGPARDDVIGELPLASAGLAVTAMIMQRFGGDRALAAARCEREARKLLGVRSSTSWSAGERLAWRRWAPLVTLLPGVSRWSAAQRTATVGIIRAKGGGREDAFARAFDAHPRLGAALASLVRATRT